MKYLLPILPLLFLILLLEWFVRENVVASFLIPAPSEVARTLISDREEYLSAALSTMSCAALGLFLSFVLGALTALLLASSDWLRRAIYPYAVFFQTVPIVAIAPLLVIWFGFGAPTVVASAFIVSVFPVIANQLMGLRSTDPALLDLFRIYTDSQWLTFIKLRLPQALPYMFTGLRVSAGLAVIGAIVGEFIAGGGLGSIVDVARTQQRVDKVFASVLVSALIGLLFLGIIELFAIMMLRNWHASKQTSSTPT